MFLFFCFYADSGVDKIRKNKTNKTNTTECDFDARGRAYTETDTHQAGARRLQNACGSVSEVKLREKTGPSPPHRLTDSPESPHQGAHRWNRGVQDLH